MADWGAVVASVAALSGDLHLAEDAAQDAYLAAMEQWPESGRPLNPRSWLIGAARNKAIDRMRREARRADKEVAAVRELRQPPPPGPIADDELALIFTCCHPALDPSTRVALTLRAVCGLTATDIAAVFLVPEATMAKRLVRARRKIRDTGIPLRVPGPDAFAERLSAVLRVIYLVFTEGHQASSGDRLVRDEQCAAAIRLARTLHGLLPDEPEVTGLLALLLLTHARRDARLDDSGEVVVLEEQDRSRWDTGLIAEGEGLVSAALRAGRPGAYQLHAAIAACHATAQRAADTDWRQIALLYGELIRYEPTPVIEAGRAVAVAMAEGPAAGLVILDAVGHHPQLARWPRLHLARADLLRRLDRRTEAAAAYRTALELEPVAAERAFILRRLTELDS